MNKEIDGFESRLIEGLLTNKPFLEHFFGQYLSCLSYDELMMFFTEYINSYDGSLDRNRDFYKPKELIKRTNNKLIPLKNAKR